MPVTLLDDDSGTQQNNTTDTQNEVNSGVNPPALSPLNSTSSPNAGTTTAGKSGTPASTPASKKPTIRKNPLSLFSSYTYQLSLYMLTPDAFNAFEESGRKNIKDLVIGKTTTDSSSSNLKGGAYLILQSGGTNNKTTPRAPGFELDYAIDELKIKSLIAPSTTGSTTIQTTFSFQVIEPYGFSFLNRLKIAADAIAQYSETLNAKEQRNPSRQKFVLGIRFQGYDSVGNLLTGKELINGSITDPNGSGNGVYETFYTINLNKINFKIDGRAVVYNISAVSVAPYETFTLMRGVFNKNVTLEASTVEEALTGPNGMIDQLNAWQKTSGALIPNVYKLEFIGDTETLRNAKIVLPNDVDKLKAGWTSAKNTVEVNEVTAARSNPNLTKKTITLLSSTSIIACVERVIVQSEYMTQALKTVYDSVNQPDPNKKDFEEEPNKDRPDTVKWYNLSSRVKVIGYDTRLNQYAYEITLLISPYETPVLVNAYSNSSQKYYGPVKRYDYWFTGKNSEVISYEQTNNNGYFIVALDPTNSTTVKSGQAGIPVVQGFPQNADVTGAKGVGMQAQGAYLTNLFDPKSFSTAKITILGDPDFLMQDSFTDVKTLPPYKTFYEADGRTINPRTGQVFIELNFKEAIDYENNTGLLDINDQIVFWQYPESIKKLVNGVSFWVRNVDATFSKGKFTQEITCSINTFGPDENAWSNASNNTTNSENQREDTREAEGRTGSSPSESGNGTTSNTGLLQEPTEQYSEVPTETPPNVSPADNENEASGGQPVDQGGREE